MVVCWAVGLRGVEAASGDADGTYTVTITTVEVSQDSGTTYATIFSGSQDINIASVNAGAVAAGLASGAALGVGTYNTVRVTIGATLRAKGYANNAGDTVYTNGGTDGSGSSTNGGVTNTPGAGYAISTYTIPAANRINTTSGLSLSVQIGTSPTVTVKFDTSGVLSVVGGGIVPGAPVVTITGS
jgi:hypothetical protein